MLFLDFEEPVAELYQQVQSLREISEKQNIDMSAAIEGLEKKMFDLKTELYGQMTPWQKVQLSRHPQRPYTNYYISQICDQYTELHGDRYFADDTAIVGGMGIIDGKSYMMIGHQKGENTNMRQYRNFGMANPEGYRKALRLMKLAEKFRKPVICFIDTPGAFPGIEAEQRGQAEAIARNLFEMSQLEVPILCIIIGEGASGGALGIGIGDKIFMLENTWYAVISPESCSSILWRSWDHKETAAEQLKLTPEDMYGFKIIDGIVKEPLGGAHHDPPVIAKTVKELIIQQVAELEALSVEDRIAQRIAKYEAIGEYTET